MSVCMVFSLYVLLFLSVTCQFTIFVFILFWLQRERDKVEEIGRHIGHVQV